MTTPRIVPEVVREHAALAAFQWAQRDTLAQEDPPDRAVIAGVDARLEANLDGLRIAGAAAWPFILEQYEEYPEKGELFVAGAMALEQAEPGRIKQVVELGRCSPDARGLVGALGWLRPQAIRGPVRSWLGSADDFRRWLAASALAEHGANPGEWLPKLLSDPDARVRRAAYTIAGRARRADVLPQLRAGLRDPDPHARYRAALSLAEVGAGGEATAALREAALAGGPDALAAMRAVVKAGPEREVRQWIGGLLHCAETAAPAVRGAGILGDRTILGWLVRMMREPALAGAAGAAFLELFPEARSEDDLFSAEPEVLAVAFGNKDIDPIAPLPVADRVLRWANEHASKLP